MTPEHMKAFSYAITRACNAAVKRGELIRYGVFDNCPIDLVTRRIQIQKTKSNSYRTRLRTRLGFSVSNKDMWAFIDGFDRLPHRNFLDPLYKLGEQFRKKYEKHIQ